MMKKYIAISMVAGSMAFGGCSSNDSADVTDAPSVTNAGGETEAPSDGDVPDATPGTAATVFDTIAQSAEHTTLFAIINSSASVVETLNSSASMLTAFAPTNTAFEGFIAADQTDAFAIVADLLDEANQAVVQRVLLGHVVPFIVSSGAIAELAVNGDTVETLAEGAPLRFAATTTVPPSAVLLDVVGAVEGSAPIALSSSIDLGSDLTQSVVHSIDSVIAVPPATTVVIVPPRPPGSAPVIPR